MTQKATEGLLASKDLTCEFSDDSWPLLDELIMQEPSAASDDEHKKRRDALHALANAAFEP